jgi:hypothetical protein
LVSSPGGQHAVPRRAWQHARCAVSPCRRWTSSAMFRAELRAPGRPFGVFRVHRPKRTGVAMRNQSARSAFRWYLESLVWQGRWGSAVAATSRQGSSRTPHRPGVPGCEPEAIALRFRGQAGAKGGQPPAVLAYPTDRIRSGSLLSSRVRGSGQSGLVELQALRRSAHIGGNTGVSELPMRSSRIPRLGAISVLAPRSPVRLSVGRGWGS